MKKIGVSILKITMNVIKRLNELRLERNLSVYRLSELSGINQSTLANTFSRGTTPSIQTLEKLCETMGITLSQFFEEDDEQMLLTKSERELMLNYRKLPAEVKEAIAQMIKSVSEIR